VVKDLKKDIAIRVDPQSGKIVGIIILNFVKRFKLKKKPEKIELPVKVTITPSQTKCGALGQKLELTYLWAVKAV